MYVFSRCVDPNLALKLLDFFYFRPKHAQRPVFKIFKNQPPFWLKSFHHFPKVVVINFCSDKP